MRDLLQKGKAYGFNVMRTWAHSVNPQYALQVWRGRVGWLGGGREERRASPAGRQRWLRVLRLMATFRRERGNRASLMPEMPLPSL